MPDAIVVGAGPNGLVAALALAGEGWRVEVLEAGPKPGGGTRSAELLTPGVVHDVCSAIHPLALASPALRDLPLAEHGLRWVHPDVPLAHPLDGGRAAVLHRDVDATAEGLDGDGRAYRRLLQPWVQAGTDLSDGLLAPLTVPPAHPLLLARFAPLGVRSAQGLGRARFQHDLARGLLAGLAAHSVLRLDAPGTAGYALMLGVLAHVVGWPLAEGGSQRIADALVAELERRGGSVTCDHEVRSLDDLRPADAVLLDLTPSQVLQVAGDRLPARYRRRLGRFRRGPGVHKVDWTLDGPVPWAAPEVAGAATVHLGGTFEEVAAAEAEVWSGRHPARPFVLFAQQSRFDRTRAPDGVHTAWGYCHVPHGSSVDVTEQVEAQVERFAPGFRDRITGRHVMGPAALEAYDANYVGGDISGGVADLRQLAMRPVPSLHPWRTPVPGLFLCSSSTPPGGGVHGMCGWLAAQEVLRAG